MNGLLNAFNLYYSVANLPRPSLWIKTLKGYTFVTST